MFVLALGVLTTLFGYTTETDIGERALYTYAILLLIILYFIGTMFIKNEGCKVFKKNKLLLALAPYIGFVVIEMILPIFLTKVTAISRVEFHVNFNPIPFLALIIPLGIGYVLYTSWFTHFFNTRLNWSLKEPTTDKTDEEK